MSENIIWKMFLSPFTITDYQHDYNNNYNVKWATAYTITYQRITSNSK